MSNDREPRSLNILLDLDVDSVSPPRNLCHHFIPFLVSSYNSFSNVVESLLLCHALSAQDVDNIVVMPELEIRSAQWISCRLRGRTNFWLPSVGIDIIWTAAQLIELRLVGNIRTVRSALAGDLWFAESPVLKHKIGDIETIGVSEFR